MTQIAQDTVKLEAELMEETLAGFVTGIEPLRVNKFPANWVQWVKENLSDCEGEVLLSLRNFQKVGQDEISKGWAFSADFIVIFHDYSGDDEQHVGGYKLVEAVTDSFPELIFLFGGTQYTADAKSGTFLTQQDERSIWVVRVDVRPTFSINR